MLFVSFRNVAADYLWLLQGHPASTKGNSTTMGHSSPIPTDLAEHVAVMLVTSPAVTSSVVGVTSGQEGLPENAAQSATNAYSTTVNFNA